MDKGEKDWQRLLTNELENNGKVFLRRYFRDTDCNTDKRGNEEKGVKNMRSLAPFTRVVAFSRRSLENQNPHKKSVTTLLLDRWELKPQI